VLHQRTPSPGATAVEDCTAPTTSPGPDSGDARWIDDDGHVLDEVDLLWTPAAPDPTATVPSAPATPRRRLTVGQLLIVLAGATALVFGIGAVGLGGLAGPVTDPVVRVFSFAHTPLLGLIETAVGTVLVLTGLVRGGRWIAGPVGVAVVAGGAVVFTGLDWVQTQLAAPQRFGWVPVIVGSVAYLGAMVPARRR